MLTAIKQWVIRTMMKSKGQTGVVQTLPKRDLIELNTQITAQKLMQGGIDPQSLKNADQVENAIIAIENKQKANLAENIRGGIGNTKSAKIFNTAGEELDPNQPIIGGTQPGKKIDTDAFIRNAEAQELETKIQKKLEKGNKEAAQRLREKSIEKFEKDQDLMELDKAIDNASPGFVKGDMKYNAQLVADDLAADRFGKDFYDLDQKQQIKLYDEAYTALSKQRFKNKLDPEDMAQGGRAGFDNGGAPSIKLFPRASGRQVEQEVGPGIKISERDLNYGITGLLQGDKFFGGAELDKGKVKIDVVTPEGDTLFKDTIGKKDAVNFILGMGDPKGDKFQIKTDKDFENMQLVLKKSFAQGGIARLGLKEGSGMTRRTFLKLLGGMAAVPIVGKFFKLAKVGQKVKEVPIIKTDNVPGKPEWFDALVNKVITEGDDVTKKFATGERQSIHQKTLDDGSVVRVTEDVDDGAVRVEYESQESMFGEPVQMQYKKPLPDEGDPRPAAEFEVSETGIVSRADGPDDFVLEGEDMIGSSIRDLDSDVSKLKQYATGKGPTMKEIVEIKKRKDKVRRLNEGDPGETSQYISDRQGDYDPSPDDFASGGIARMLGE